MNNPHRYCSKCKKIVAVGRDPQKGRFDCCVVCGQYVYLHFTLRQRGTLRRIFESQNIPSAQVSEWMFNRRGAVGSVVLVTETGLSLDFLGPAPSIEHWEWNELEVAHLLPEGTSLELTPPGSMWRFGVGDALMMDNGRAYSVSRRVAVRRDPPKFYASTDVDSVLISRTKLPKIVDWIAKGDPCR